MTTFFFVASPSAPFPYGGGTFTSARGVLRMDSGEEVPVYGPYEVVRLLGSGGMGVVYLATTSGGRRVAVKVIRESYASDPVFRLRFAREVAAARTVSGAFTAPVVDADITGPVLWMATSYVQGPTLSEHVEADGPLEPDAVLELAAGLAEALRDIHRVGLVHRDLKPSNILLSDDGPRVIDFGVSRAADAEPLTQTGTLLGTPPYMAPEQLVAPKKTGTEADVFALGSVLVYAATGHGPFDADNAYGIAYNIVHEPPGLHDLPPALGPIVKLCLAKEPQDRPTADDLLTLLSSRPTLPTAQPTAVPAAPVSRKPRTRAIIAAAGTVALLTGAIVWTVRPHHAAAPAAHTTTAPTHGPLREQHAALRPKGWAKWETQMPGELPGVGVAPDCVLGSRQIICRQDPGTIAAFDRNSGHLIWQRPGDHGEPDLIDAPVTDGLFYTQTMNESGDLGQVSARDAVTGKLRWRISIPPAVGQSVQVSGLLVAMAQNEADGHTYAWDARTGKPRWNKPFGIGYRDMNCDFISSDAMLVLCAQDGKRADLLRLNAGTGAVQWKDTSATYSLDYVGDSHGQQVFAEWKDTSTTVTSTLEVVDPTDGRDRQVRLKKPAMGTLTVSGPTLYAIRADGQLNAFNLATGALTWSIAIGSDANGSIAIADGQVCVQTAQAEIDCRDQATGRDLWRSAPRRDPDSSVPSYVFSHPPLFVDSGTVFATSNRNTVFALTPPTATRQASASPLLS